MRKIAKELVNNFADIRGYIDLKLAFILATSCLLFAGMIAFSISVVVHEVNAADLPTADQVQESIEIPLPGAPAIAGFGAISIINDADAETETETEETTPDQTEDATEPTSEPVYSEEEAILLAQVMLNEAGGVPSKTEQSMVAWTVLNRVDDGRFGGSVYEVLAAPAQFAWWSGTAVRDDLLVLARDVLIRYNREKNGEVSVGRTLPEGYLYFYGDGSHNHFYTGSGGDSSYNFSDYPTPYET